LQTAAEPTSTQPAHSAGHSKIERRLIGGFGSLLLFTWLLICITDVNHPPGVRWIRMLIGVLVLSIGALEYFRPRRGFYLLLLLWPNMLVVRELLATHVSPLLAAIPNFWGGPASAALLCAVWLRSESDSPATRSVSARRVLPFYYALCLLIIAWIVAAVFGVWRSTHPPADWRVDATDVRHLLDPGLFVGLYPALLSLEILPALLLGALLLHLLSRGELTGETAVPVRTVVLTAAIGATIAAMLFTLQMITGGQWAFNQGTMAGPFISRNTVAPVLILSGVLWFYLWKSESLARRWTFLMAGIALLFLACASASRNGLFLIASFGFLLLFFKASMRRMAIAAASLLILVAALFHAPLPAAYNQRDEMARRTIETIQDVRAGNWDKAFGYRLQLYYAAAAIAADYPVTGSGPGTFPMQVRPGTRYSKMVHEAEIFSAHSLPVNLLAEIGLIGMAAWVVFWIVLPWIGLARWPAGNFLMLATLLAGFANLLDTVWYAPGMTLICVLLPVLACAEMLKTTDSIPGVNK
jgi:O-antigen ligase